MMFILTKRYTRIVNLPALETIIQSIESFARDASDLPTARLAFSVLTRMTVVWGGPDLQADTNSVPSKPRQTLMDWQDTAITRFTPLSWQLITSPKFDVKNSQARQVLNEIAGMQLQIFRRSGSRYLESLRNQLGSLGVDQATIEEYLCALSEKDGKTFKMFFVQLFFRQSGA